MTIKELANLLDGREHGSEISSVECVQAQESGLVLVYIASDCLCKISGAIEDKAPCYKGWTTMLLTPDCALSSAMGDRDDCKYWQAAKTSSKSIDIFWRDGSGYVWNFKTDIPHEAFSILKGGEKYCRGLVFEPASLA